MCEEHVDKAADLIVKCWCNDCTGIDPYGCFDGREWYMTADGQSTEALEEAGHFSTVEAAEAVAADRDTWPGRPWCYEIVAGTA